MICIKYFHSKSSVLIIHDSVVWIGQRLSVWHTLRYDQRQQVVPMGLTFTHDLMITHSLHTLCFNLSSVASSCKWQKWICYTFWHIKQPARFLSDGLCQTPFSFASALRRWSSSQLLLLRLPRDRELERWDGAGGFNCRGLWVTDEIEWDGHEESHKQEGMRRGKDGVMLKEE